MRALAMTGMVTVSWMPLIMAGSLIRATPPSRRMSAGTRSSAITADAPASSAILACSASTTSMMTPPFSISASPALTRNVASSRITTHHRAARAAVYFRRKALIRSAYCSASRLYTPYASAWIIDSSAVCERT